MLTWLRNLDWCKFFAAEFIHHLAVGAYCGTHSRVPEADWHWGLSGVCVLCFLLSAQMQLPRELPG